MRRLIARVLQSNMPADQRGGQALEYALVAGLVVMGSIAVIASTGKRLRSGWNDIDKGLDVKKEKGKGDD
jgi:Flp pilus assembly pilin Flp